MDDDKFRDIIASLPEKVSRSRLEPYRELIAELRRLGRTYREIAHLLGEKCQVHVSAAAVHNFVRLHLRRKRNPSRRQPLGFLAAHQVATPGTNERPVSVTNRTRATSPPASDEEVRRRIEELKRRPASVDTTPVLFHYDPNEPLHLLPKSEKK
jgi:hypothetical protein